MIQLLKWDIDPCLACYPPSPGWILTRHYGAVILICEWMCVFAVAEWGETHPETHRAHAHRERWRGRNITHSAELFTSSPHDFSYGSLKKKRPSTFFFTKFFCRDNLMHPRLFVTSYDSVETRPISCQRSQIQTPYLLSWSRKCPIWLAKITVM